jgi:hypothetical protein
MPDFGSPLSVTNQKINTECCDFTIYKKHGMNRGAIFFNDLSGNKISESTGLWLRITQHKDGVIFSGMMFMKICSLDQNVFGDKCTQTACVPT